MPFHKVVAAGGGAAAGSIAGPLGTLGGAVVRIFLSDSVEQWKISWIMSKAQVGLGVDFTVNAGVELVKREEFVKDVERWKLEKEILFSL